MAENNRYSKNLILIRQMIKSAENSIKSAQKLLDDMQPDIAESVGSPEDLKEKASHLSVMEGGKIIEGVFDGQNMVGPDGRIFPVPANYASKSKLVEGDILKLTIADNGSFIFKQIGPVDRKKIIGTVVKDDEGEFKVIVGDRSYKVLLASITYFKAEINDEITIIIPRDKESTWAAVENVIKANPTDADIEQNAEEAESVLKPVNLGSKDDDFLEIGSEKESDEE